MIKNIFAFALIFWGIYSFSMGGRNQPNPQQFNGEYRLGIGSRLGNKEEQRLSWECPKKLIVFYNQELNTIFLKDFKFENRLPSFPNINGGIMIPRFIDGSSFYYDAFEAQTVLSKKKVVYQENMWDRELFLGERGEDFKVALFNYQMEKKDDNSLLLTLELTEHPLIKSNRSQCLYSPLQGTM